MEWQNGQSKSDIMQIKSLTYVYLFKKFVDYNLDYEYQKLYKQLFIMSQLIQGFWMFFLKIPFFCYQTIKHSVSS